MFIQNSFNLFDFKKFYKTSKMGGGREGPEQKVFSSTGFMKGTS